MNDVESERTPTGLAPSADMSTTTDIWPSSEPSGSGSSANTYETEVAECVRPRQSSRS
ncbi:hypothetical protein GGF41_001304 [Coemansia sp. RSA 2531]|nr:hypothetical protein GGF41_001304 [Coemansia sp. RSA 2531]